MSTPPLKFRNHSLLLLDQRKLPTQEIWINCDDEKKVHWAIRVMVVRGAPAIGIAGGYGLYLGMKKFKGSAVAFEKRLFQVSAYLKSSRPTGVNLRNVIDRIVIRIQRTAHLPVASRLKLLKEEAMIAHQEDDALCHAIGRHGQKLFKNGDNLLTHCNAGGLATSGYGTALAVFFACKEAGKKIHVFADETRPLLQGARLTAWELVKNRISCTLLCDNMAASVMRENRIAGIVVGADRIAANGDTANKIGTYGLAVLAKEHGVPFYIAAPGTTFDFSIASGKGIPIENREEQEVKNFAGTQTAPKLVRAANPAFDVTPSKYIHGFITEEGVLRPPFSQSFKKIKKKYKPE